MKSSDDSGENQVLLVKIRASHNDKIDSVLEKGNSNENFKPSWHSDVVTTLSQRRCWRCHVVVRSKMRVVPTSVSNVVTTSLSNVAKTLPQRCYYVATTLSIGLLGHSTTDYSDFFPFIEAWKLQKCYMTLNTHRFSLKKRYIYS